MPNEPVEYVLYFNTVPGVPMLRIPTHISPEDAKKLLNEIQQIIEYTTKLTYEKCAKIVEKEKGWKPKFIDNPSYALHGDFVDLPGTLKSIVKAFHKKAALSKEQ